jgi:hypothetical protein
MVDFEYGPVEVVLAGFEGDRPGTGVLEAIAELADAGTVRLLDVLFVARDQQGVVTAIEIADDEDGFGLGELELEATGLAAMEDIETLAEAIPLGTSAALMIVELTWAKHLAAKLFESGGFVIASERIPAAVVNVAAAEAFIEMELEEIEDER